MKKLILLFLLFFISGCAYTSQVKQPSHNLLVENSAKIYVMRGREMWASLFTPPIYINNTYVGTIGIGGYLSWLVHSGHNIVRTTKGLATMEFDNDISHQVSFTAEKGKIYYIRLLPVYQIYLGAPSFKLSLLNKNEGAAMLKNITS